MTKLLNVSEAAALLNCSESYVRILARERRIPSVRLGRRMMFTGEDLEKWVDENKQPVSAQFFFWKKAKR